MPIENVFSIEGRGTVVTGKIERGVVRAGERLGPSLVIRGHAHWKQPLVQLSGGVQVLNVDARVVVLHK